MKIKDLTIDMQSRIKRAMNTTWHTIADDIFGCVERDSIPQREVIEVVLDAEYVQTHGGDEEAAKVLYSLSPADQKKLARTVFPYKRYYK
jgi:hypothetical protein